MLEQVFTTEITEPTEAKSVDSIIARVLSVLSLLTVCSVAHLRPRFIATVCAPILAAFCPAASAVQVQDLVRLKGSETSKLVGMGLVVGLRGTGDGGKFMPAMRPLASVIQELIDPNTVAAELKDAKNVALVAISAELPASGVREGDRVDVHLSAVGAAKSLAGGRLFMIPLTGPMRGSPVYAFAEGAVTVEDENNATVGVVRQGAQLTRDVMTRYLDEQGRLTLVLNDSVASWPVASNIAALINGVVAPDGPNVAKAVNEKNVAVFVPEFERADPAAFITQILMSYVDPSQIGGGARVVINERTGTIVVGGDVQVSPVIISHPALTITTLVPAARPTEDRPIEVENRFVGVDPEKRGGAKLEDLIAAFNQLKVDAKDRIEILKEIERSGKLHAKLVIE